MITKYQNNHSSIGTSFKYYLGNKDYSQKQVEHRDTKNEDNLGHRDTENANKYVGTQGH